MLHRPTQEYDAAAMSLKHVALIGGGGVGSFIALCLGQLVGKLTVVDPKSISKENVERHLAGKDWVDQPKVLAIRHIVTSHFGLNDDSIATLKCKGIDALPELEDVDLVIDATNDPDFRHELNMWAIDFNVPVVYAGVYAGGNGWQVDALPNPLQVCYMCLDLSRSGMERHEETLATYGRRLNGIAGIMIEASPGLITAVMASAATTAEIALDILHGRSNQPFLYRTAYQTRPLMLLNDPKMVRMAELVIDLQRGLGLEQYELIEEDEGFTLQQKTGSIRLNIRQASGCPFHDETPIEGVEGG